MAEPIELTDERDRGFATIAQGSLVNATILPSGYRTPDRDLVVEGTSLVEPSPAQRRHFDDMAKRHRRPY